MATKITISGVGEFATLGITTDLVEPYKFVWKRNGVPVGGNHKSYTTPPLRPDDFKAKYSCTVTGIEKSEEADAILIVAPAAPPKPATSPTPEQIKAQQEAAADKAAADKLAAEGKS